jgi:hypothetical protein
MFHPLLIYSSVRLDNKPGMDPSLCACSARLLKEVQFFRLLYERELSDEDDRDSMYLGRCSLRVE